MSKSSIRAVINTLLVVSWILVLVSGVFTAFELRSPVIELCHKMGAFIFIICLMVHVMKNRKALFESTKGKLSFKLIAVILVVCVVGMGLSAYFMPSGQVKAGAAAPAASAAPGARAQ